MAIVPGSPADRAGLKENDIITHVNGEEIPEDTDLIELLKKLKVGDEIELTLLRAGQELKAKTILEERK